MAFLIEWMYDRKNGAQHSVIAADLRRYSEDDHFLHYKTRYNFWRPINLKKIAWLRIKPAPKPYMPPVGQTEGSEYSEIAQ